MATEPYTIDGALQKLHDAVKIVSEDSKSYYMKEAKDVKDVLLKDVSLSIIPLSNLMMQFSDYWFGSIHSGPDAIQPTEKLEDRIDIKLFKDGKLDFDHLGKIMTRLNRIDDALYGLSRIDFYLRYYEKLCDEKALTDLSSLVGKFRSFIVDEARNSLQSESIRLGHQIERCSLYYQPRIKTLAYWVALASLGVSCLAFFVALLNALR